MRILLTILLTILLYSCNYNTSQNIYSNNIIKEDEFKNIINESIIDGFYDNDSTKIPKNAYFIK